jgi:hypothetical protein
MGADDASTIVARLIRRSDPRSEADVQADVRALLLSGELDLADAHVALEAPVPGRRRIDVEVGAAVIEVKKDLSRGHVLDEAEIQLSGYLAERQALHGSRYVGVLTDGFEWRDYHLSPNGTLVPVSALEVRSADRAGDLLVWLEGILATRRSIIATPREIERRLGATSSASQLDLSDLAAIYQAHTDLPTVQIKRELWARLLTVAFGTAFENDSDLFVSHTYLTVVAELIAHAVLGYDLAAEARDPDELLLGRRFTAAGISGVVDSDFFDWVLEVDEGRRWVSGLARRIGRFEWADVQHDVLKILYETVIDADTRHSLGEYYTPDWLARAVVAESLTDAVTQRVCDPACGSGTFLFHVIRAAIAACEAAGMDNAEVIDSVTSRVFGLDVHPVAVTLARVTYLLALGSERLKGPRDRFSVPVYLGDAVQFHENHNLLDDEGLTVYTTDGARLFETDLRFPERVVSDVARFDMLVSAMTDKAAQRASGTKPPSLRGIYSAHGVHPDDQSTLDTTFKTLCELQDEGRNHVWGYYVRNAARPGWLARLENRVDVLVGNPPWLAYNFMPSEMQGDFRRLAIERGLWPEAKVVTKQDLAGLFVARAIEQYLAIGGRFGFVMPESALTRTTYTPFRRGRWKSPTSTTFAQFEVPWDLTDVSPPPFPVPSAVVFGTRHASEYAPLEGKVTAWSGDPSQELKQSTVPLVQVPAASDDWSPYRQRFAQGATVSPRVLFVVEPADVGPLGLPSGQSAVRSSRSSLEKQPWKRLPDLTGQVEDKFVFELHTGNSLVPFRMLTPEQAVMPWDGHRLLDGEGTELGRWPGFAAWWEKATDLWEQNKTKSTELSLLERLDFQRGFTRQVEALTPRVYYSSSGNHLAAAWSDDLNVIVNNRLYWAVASGVREARYLCAVLNAPVTTELVTPLMGKGLFGARDFHLWVWALPIPIFDSHNELHEQLIALAERAEQVAAAQDLAGVGFQRARGVVRAALTASGIASDLNEVVGQVLLESSECA